MNRLFQSLYELGIRQGFQDFTCELPAWALELTTGKLTELKDPVEVPSRIVGRGNTGASNFTFDSSKYVLDATSAFWAYTLEMVKKDREALKAIEAYLEKPPKFKDPFKDAERKIQGDPWVILTLKGKPLCNRPKLKEAYAAKRVADTQEGPEGVCLLSGKTAPLARLHPAIIFGNGGKGSDAKLVSVNESAMEYYGTIQGFNYPVSGLAARYYGSALNMQMKNSSAFLTPECAVVFWPDAGTDHPIIAVIKALLDEYVKDVDAQSALGLWKQVRDNLNSKDVLHVAAMQLKMSRILVRDYVTVTVGEICTNLWRFFMEFYGTSKVINLRRIIPYSSRSGEPSLSQSDFIGSAWAVLMGTPFPVGLKLLLKHAYIQRGVYNIRVFTWINVLHNRTKPEFKESPLTMLDTPLNEDALADAPLDEDEENDGAENVIAEYVKQDWEAFCADVQKYVSKDANQADPNYLLYQYGRMVSLRYAITAQYHARRGKYQVPNLLQKILRESDRPKMFLGNKRFVTYCEGTSRLVSYHSKLYSELSEILPKLPSHISEEQNMHVLRGFHDQQRGCSLNRRRNIEYAKAKKQEEAVKLAS